MSDCDKVAAVLLREDVHNVCKITFRRTESGGSTSLRDVSLKKYSSYGDFQEELESVLLSAAACHDHKSFEHLEILRILRLGTSLITALLSTNNVESEATGKRKEKKANDIRPSPLSNIQKVAMYKQDFDGSYNFSSTLPAFLLDLGQSTDPNMILITPSSGSKDSGDMGTLGALQPRRYGFSKPANPKYPAENEGYVHDTTDDVFNSFIPSTIPVSSLSSAECAYTENKRWASEVLPTDELLHQHKESKLNHGAVSHGYIAQINHKIAIMDAISASGEMDFSQMEILKAGLLEIASQVSPKDTELLHERILAPMDPTFRGNLRT